MLEVISNTKILNFFNSPTSYFYHALGFNLNLAKKPNLRGMTTSAAAILTNTTKQASYNATTLVNPKALAPSLNAFQQTPKYSFWDGFNGAFNGYMIFYLLTNIVGWLCYRSIEKVPSIRNKGFFTQLALILISTAAQWYSLIYDLVVNINLIRNVIWPIMSSINLDPFLPVVTTLETNGLILGLTVLSAIPMYLAAKRLGYMGGHSTFIFMMGLLGTILGLVGWNLPFYMKSFDSNGTEVAKWNGLGEGSFQALCNVFLVDLSVRLYKTYRACKHHEPDTTEYKSWWGYAIKMPVIIIIAGIAGMYWQRVFSKVREGLILSDFGTYAQPFWVAMYAICLALIVSWFDRMAGVAIPIVQALTANTQGARGFMPMLVCILTTAWNSIVECVDNSREELVAEKKLLKEIARKVQGNQEQPTFATNNIYTLYQDTTGGVGASMAASGSVTSSSYKPTGPSNR